MKILRYKEDISTVEGLIFSATKTSPIKIMLIYFWLKHIYRNEKKPSVFNELLHADLNY